MTPSRPWDERPHHYRIEPRDRRACFRPCTGNAFGLLRDLLCRWHEHLGSDADFPALRGKGASG